MNGDIFFLIFVLVGVVLYSAALAKKRNNRINELNDVLGGDWYYCGTLRCYVCSITGRRAT